MLNIKEEQWKQQGFLPKVVFFLLLFPAAEIDHVSSLFQEKQAELQSAVIRVDQVLWICYEDRPAFFQKQLQYSLVNFSCFQLTQQLEDLRRGRLQLHSGAPAQGAFPGTQGAGTGHKGSPLSGPAAVELRKLYQELQVVCTFPQTPASVEFQMAEKYTKCDMVYNFITNNEMTRA